MALQATRAKKRVLRFDPDYDPDEGGMEFRLTFEGPLRAANTGERDTKTSRKEYKHWVRQQFQPQLRALWEQTPFLKNATRSGPTALILEGSPDAPDYSIEARAKKFALYGWNFVPLVTSDLGLLCSLDILYLRRMKFAEKPGNVLEGNGDIDNRIKTLFDCLQIPDANQGYSDMKPAKDEVPLFCLLENDKLVTKVAVEADRLLQDVPNPFKDPENDARLVITVRIRPYEMDLNNMQFG